ATERPCNMPKAVVFDFGNNAEQDGWKSSSSEASRQRKHGADKKVQDSKAIVVTFEDGITKIVFNRPTKKNAITFQIHSSSRMRTGDYYCCGNDLSILINANSEIQDVAIKCAMAMRELISSFIDFPKPLVAVVNGPAVGIAVTLLGLFDAVYASEKAMFYIPFSQLGQSPEACSSYTFPKMMGPTKATEMLLFGKKLTAREAWAQGLVTEVFPESTFEKEVWTRLKAYVKLPPNIKLMRKNEKQKLRAVNAEESTTIQERLTSEDCTNALMNFMSRKAKL
ncbi:hypothetical protein A6R68_11932, partial [Neotoma lepida]